MGHSLLRGGISHPDGRLQDRHTLPAGPGQDLHLELEASGRNGNVQHLGQGIESDFSNMLITQVPQPPATRAPEMRGAGPDSEPCQRQKKEKNPFDVTAGYDLPGEERSIRANHHYSSTRPPPALMTLCGQRGWPSTCDETGARTLDLRVVW